MAGPDRSGSAAGGGRPAPAATLTGFNPARRKARRRALDVLYQADLRDTAIATILSGTLTRLGRDRPDYVDYAVVLAEGVAAHREHIDELIASFAEGWTLDRMPAVDRNLCRIAIFELIYGGEVDDAVAISEAVALAQELSTDDSPRFVNGLLDRIARYATR